MTSKVYDSAAAALEAAAEMYAKERESLILGEMYFGSLSST